MPGGDRGRYEHLRPISGDRRQGGRRRRRASPTSARAAPGHFVKMVHNGIEYGDMQLIAEAYDLLRKRSASKRRELADIFAEWNKAS
jgi:6-phosphogluconate dehydrogenase